MPSTVDHTFVCALSGGFRRDVDADSATVSVKLLVAGAPSGGDLTIQAAPPSTAPSMTQYAPGHFTFTSTGAPFTRGGTYRATYTVVYGGVSETQTQDFTAFSAAYAPRAAAFHTVSFFRAKNIVRQALGLKPESAAGAGDGKEPGQYTAAEYVQQAIESLWNRRRWSWQLAEPFYFDLVANMDRVLLPDDYLEIAPDGLRRRGTTLVKFRMADLSWIRRMRETDSSFTDQVIRYCIVSDPPPDPTGRTRYALELWPPPTAFVQAAAVLDYYRQCPVLSADTDILPFPHGFAQIVKDAIRAEAFEGEGDAENAAAARDKFEGLFSVQARAHDDRAEGEDLGLVGAKPCEEDEGPHDPYASVDVD